MAESSFGDNVVVTRSDLGPGRTPACEIMHVAKVFYMECQHGWLKGQMSQAL